MLDNFKFNFSRGPPGNFENVGSKTYDFRVVLSSLANERMTIVSFTSDYVSKHPSERDSETLTDIRWIFGIYFDLFFFEINK